MVDETRVLRLLRGLNQALDALDREAEAGAARRADPLWLPGVKYLLVTSVEACLDVAQHLCAAQGWGPPRDNGDAMTLLGKHGVLTEPAAAKLRRAVGFRNVLVHGYAEVDDGIVGGRVHNLGDLREFATAVAGWLESEARLRGS